MKKISFPNLLKKSLPAVYALALVLTLLMAFVGYSTSRKIHHTITQQFNEQQLILARKISDHIQNQISNLETTLLEMKIIAELDGSGGFSHPQGIFQQVQNLLTGDVLAILMVDGQGKTIRKTLAPNWHPRTIPLPTPPSLAGFLKSSKVPNRVWLGNSFSLSGKWVLPIGIPLKIKGKPAAIGGAIFFLIDTIHISQKATQGVVSGNTGYAWIINSQGILLDHFEKDFIGKNIFEVRKAKNPQLSYKKIDDLTRDELLQQKEGTSTYTSGWHRSNRTTTEKLIAYTPIPFYETSERNLGPEPVKAREFWSVALVAPVEEISGLVWSINFQKALLIGLCQLCIILGTGLWVYISQRWAKYLKVEIDNKTEELRKSQERLIQSERLAAVGSMASHVSHEIKNPLIAIGGLANQLARFPLLGEKEKGKLNLITTEVRRLENILLDMRDFTRPTIPHKSKVGINPVLLDLVRLFNPLITEQQITVKTELDPALPSFFFDPEQIKQVFLNLIKNAIEAMPQGGTLILRTAQYQESVLTKISDTGKGIDPKVRDRLFRPFVTTKQKGTGLGLAVSFKLIQDHNGDIQVESSENGTTMTVVLPIERE